MKTKITILAVLLLSITTFAQQGINYKAALKDASGNPLTTTITVTFTIHASSTTGTVVYSEEHTGVTPDANGIIIVTIGTGTPTTGTFSTINWSITNFLNTTISYGTPPVTTTVDLGTTQFMAVPYAKHAETALDTQTANNGLSVDGNTVIDNGAGWHRSYGPTGWYNGSYGGGIYMQDNSWIRIYGNKSFLLPSGTFQVGGTGATGTGTFKVTSGGHIIYKDGNQGLNKVLTSDSSGVATWQTNPGATSINGLSDGKSDGYSVFLGPYAGISDNSAGNSNVGLGHAALNTNVAGQRSTAIGTDAMYYANNTATAYYSGNVAVGFAALRGSYPPANNTGTFNSAVGYETLYSNSSGFRNTTNGAFSLYFNTTGNDNTANGYSALYRNNTGNFNTAIGHVALYNNTTGSYNTAIGNYAYYYGNYTNSTALGDGTLVTASNQVRIGHNVTSIGGPVGWSTISDGRFKKNIKENVAGLNFIMQLRPVTYHLNLDAYNRFVKTPKEVQKINSTLDKELQVGFVAQEVAQAAQKVGFDFHGVDKPKNANDYYSLRYAEFVVPLVKAVQEQQKEIDQLKKMVNQLLKK